MRFNPTLIDLSKIDNLATLIKYRRWFIFILRCNLVSGVATASGLAIGLMFGFSDVDLIVLVVSTVVMLVSFIPATFSWILLEEVEKICKTKFYLNQQTYSNRLPIHVMKMLFWFVLAVVGPGLIRFLVDILSKGQ